MKRKELKGFVKESLNNYLKDYYKVNFRFNYLFKNSKNDVRLAEMVQAYLLTTENKNAKKLNELSPYTYKNLKEFLSSDNKYVLEYNSYLESMKDVKGVYRERLVDLMNEQGLTMYRVSKLAKTNQSNVSKFFNKNDNNALSLNKLKYMTKVLSRVQRLENHKKFSTVK